MNTTKYFLYFSIIVILSILTVGDNSNSQQTPQPSIVGTYKLEARILPNRQVIRAPDVMGMLTYTKDYRNFNVFWTNSEGKVYSYSVVSKYELTPDEYTENILFGVITDQIGGKEIEYVLSGPSKSEQVRIDGNRIIFNLPFDPVSVVFKDGTIFAYGPDFVDVWEKVQ